MRSTHRRQRSQQAGRKAWPGRRDGTTGSFNGAERRHVYTRCLLHRRIHPSHLPGRPHSCRVQSLSNANPGFRIAKFEGASIKTVSGIRGQIKRALSKPEGHFRATFEDKILMSDIVFLRASCPVKPHKFYNPAMNLLDAPPSSAGDSEAEDAAAIEGWQGMRLTGQVRASLIFPRRNKKTRDTGLLNVQSDISIRCVCLGRWPPTSLSSHKSPYKSLVRHRNTCRSAPWYWVLRRRRPGI
jgi:hypothetical protein